MLIQVGRVDLESIRCLGHMLPKQYFAGLWFGSAGGLAGCSKGSLK